MVEGKSASILATLEILKRKTDKNHPLMQQEIVALMDELYGICIERKTVGKNLQLLREFGYDVVSTQRGAYLNERDFENIEMRILIDAVLSSRAVNDSHSKKLLEKISALGGEHYNSHTKNINSISTWNKTENNEVFRSIDIIDDAIENKQSLRVVYSKYDVTKELNKNRIFVISPYQLFIHNQRYYLMCKATSFEDITFLKVDKITKISRTKEPYVPVTSLPDYKNGIDYSQLLSARPYMYSDPAVTIQARCDKTIVDDIIDWFGKGVSFNKDSSGDKTFLAYIHASPSAFKFWALQYGSRVEVLYPEELRTSIKDILRDMCKKYKV